MPCASVRPKPSSSAASHMSIAAALLAQLGVGAAHQLAHALGVADEEAGRELQARPCWIARRITRRST